MSVSSLIDMFYGYPNIAQNEYVYEQSGYDASSSIRVKWPEDCVTQNQRKAFAKCLFFYIAQQNIKAGGGVGRRRRTMTTWHPEDRLCADGSGGTEFAVSPRHRYVKVFIGQAAAGSRSHVQGAIVFAEANWRKPQHFPYP